MLGLVTSVSLLAGVMARLISTVVLTVLLRLFSVVSSIRGYPLGRTRRGITRRWTVLVKGGLSW